MISFSLTSILRIGVAVIRKFAILQFTAISIQRIENNIRIELAPRRGERQVYARRGDRQLCILNAHMPHYR